MNHICVMHHICERCMSAGVAAEREERGGISRAWCAQPSNSFLRVIDLRRGVRSEGCRKSKRHRPPSPVPAARSSQVAARRRARPAEGKLLATCRD